MMAPTDPDAMVRIQTYRQIFTAIDTDFTNVVELDELEEFCEFMMGQDWDQDEGLEFLRRYDIDVSGGLDFTEFVVFCEENIITRGVKDQTILRQMATLGSK